MNSFQKKSLQVGLALMAITLLIGCGSSKTSDGFGNVVDAASTAPTQTSVAQAVCSQDVSGLPDLQVRLMQYADGFGQTSDAYTRLQFKMAPAAWQTGNLDMLIYRWTSASDNSVSLDSTPLYFQFEKKVPAGFQLLSSTSYQIFNWTEIQQMGTFANINTGSPQAFFSIVNLLVNLKDSTNSYQVLRVVFRDSSTGTVVQRADVLIPTYQADPALYNADSRHSVSLQVLHPLKDKLGQTWTPANYFEFARAFCF